VFQVKISAPDEQFTRVGVQVLDRKDGSFIVRYRMYASYRNLKIEVKHHGQHVAESPYVLRGILKQKFMVGFVYKKACHSINKNSIKNLAYFFH
jgi:hypothetical protein